MDGVDGRVVQGTGMREQDDEISSGSGNVFPTKWNGYGMMTVCMASILEWDDSTIGPIGEDFKLCRVAIGNHCSEARGHDDGYNGCNGYDYGAENVGVHESLTKT